MLHPPPQVFPLPLFLLRSLGAKKRVRTNRTPTDRAHSSASISFFFFPCGQIARRPPDFLQLSMDTTMIERMMDRRVFPFPFFVLSLHLQDVDVAFRSFSLPSPSCLSDRAGRTSAPKLKDAVPASTFFPFFLFFFSSFSFPPSLAGRREETPP